MPVGGSETNAVTPGRLDLHLGTSMLTATTSHVEDCPDLGPQCSGSSNGLSRPTPYRHHVALFLDETSFDAGYGLLPWLALEARFAVRVVDVNPSYFELDGTPKDVTNDTHHKKETIVGPTDPWLLVRFGGASGKVVTAARMGLSFPLGQTVPDPYLLGAEGKPHEHIQLGTGTFVPIAGGSAAWLGEPIEVSLSALAFFSLYENAEGYRAPSRYFVSLRGTMPFASGAWRPYIAVDFVHEARERWHGSPGLESYVRADLLAGGGVAYRFAGEWQAEIGVRARIANLAGGVTLDYPGLVMFGLGTHFDFGGPSLKGSLHR